MTGLRVAAAALVAGALALAGETVWGCSARTPYCVAWSLAGLIGGIVVLVALALVLYFYRRRRPTVLAWSASLRARPDAPERRNSLE